jgi:hypothetical protein
MGVPLNHPVVMDDQFFVLNKHGDLGIPHEESPHGFYMLLSSNVNKHE